MAAKKAGTRLTGSRKGTKAAMATSASATAVAARPVKRPVKRVAKRAVPRPPGAKRTRPPGGRGRRLPPPWVHRLFAEPNVDGPRIRVGLVWFVLLAPAVYFGPVPTAVLFGLLAVIAALQAGREWSHVGFRPSRLVAAAGALALPVAAIWSYAAPGLIIAVLPVVALGAALLVRRPRRGTSAVAAAGATLRTALPAGLAAAGMVFTARLGVAPALAFVILVCAYDMGHFVVGAESKSPAVGVIAGAITTMVFAAPMWFLGLTFKVPPFDGGYPAWIFGGMVAVFAPLGQIVASLALPTASTWVPALRRLDSYILTAPLWAWAMWGYLGG